MKALPPLLALLAGRPAVVTGAGAGIGRATSLALAAAGFEVVAVDVDEAAAKTTAAGCTGRADASAYQADVADLDSVHDMATAVLAEHGAPAVVVNNAGIGMSGRFLDTTPEDWRRIVGINLLGIVNVCGELVPAMLASSRPGRVVNVASGLGYMPTAGEPAYCATKAAVISLSRSQRADWRPHGVSVSAVCPGVINTGILERATFRGEAAEAESVARTKRLFAHGHPPELVAAAILRRAIAEDRAIVPVGVEAHLGWSMRHLPPRSWDFLARLSARVR